MPLALPSDIDFTNVAALELTLEGRWVVHCQPPAIRPALLLPGAFNPVHEGHWALAETAGRLHHGPVAFELSMSNVDKADLSRGEVVRRAEQLAGRASLWVTRAATFVQKAELFPQTIFVVGADTAARIVACRYYGQCQESMLRALANLRDKKCRFLVGGRLDAGQRFLRLQDLAIPADFQDLFEEIPPQEFRRDISSTELRHDSQNPPAQSRR
jgi:hypothetical protein